LAIFAADPPRLVARKGGSSKQYIGRNQQGRSGAASHIAGKWLLASSTVAHELVCKCKAMSLPITQQMARFTNR